MKNNEEAYIRLLSNKIYERKKGHHPNAILRRLLTDYLEATSSSVPFFSSMFRNHSILARELIQELSDSKNPPATNWKTPRQVVMPKKLFVIPKKLTDYLNSSAPINVQGDFYSLLSVFFGYYHSMISEDTGTNSQILKNIKERGRQITEIRAEKVNNKIKKVVGTLISISDNKIYSNGINSAEREISNLLTSITINKSISKIVAKEIFDFLKAKFFFTGPYLHKGSYRTVDLLSHVIVHIGKNDVKSLIDQMLTPFDKNSNILTELNKGDRFSIFNQLCTLLTHIKAPLGKEYILNIVKKTAPLMLNIKSDQWWKHIFYPLMRALHAYSRSQKENQTLELIVSVLFKYIKEDNLAKIGLKSFASLIRGHAFPKYGDHYYSCADASNAMDFIMASKENLPSNSTDCKQDLSMPYLSDLLLYSVIIANERVPKRFLKPMLKHFKENMGYIKKQAGFYRESALESFVVLAFTLAAYTWDVKTLEDICGEKLDHKNTNNEVYVSNLKQKIFIEILVPLITGIDMKYQAFSKPKLPGHPLPQLNHDPELKKILSTLLIRNDTAHNLLLRLEVVQAMGSHLQVEQRVISSIITPLKRLTKKITRAIFPDIKNRDSKKKEMGEIDPRIILKRVATEEGLLKFNVIESLFRIPDYNYNSSGPTYQQYSSALKKMKTHTEAARNMIKHYGNASHFFQTSNERLHRENKELEARLSTVARVLRNPELESYILRQPSN